MLCYCWFYLRRHVIFIANVPRCISNSHRKDAVNADQCAFPVQFIVSYMRINLVDNVDVNVRNCIIARLRAQEVNKKVTVPTETSILFCRNQQVVCSSR